MRREKQSRCELNYRGLSVVTDCNEPGPAEWLGEFFAPYLQDKSQSTSRREIRVVIDAQLYEQISARNDDSATREIDCFTMDGRFERHILCGDERDGRLIHIRNAKLFVHIGSGSEPIELIAHADHWAMRSAMMRVVRELATLESLQCGDLFVHASAAVYKGRAILIAGRKGAGKTTMLLNALRQPGVDFLSNDRVMVELSSAGHVARGMPTIIRVWPECLVHIPSLRKPAWEHPYRYYVTMEESERGSEVIVPTPLDVAGMYAGQLCRWLGVRAVASAPVTAIVFPRVDPEVERFDLREINGPGAQDRLFTELYSTHSKGPVPEAFDGVFDGKFSDDNAKRDACRRLVEQCRLYDCHMGPQAYGSPNVWDAIVAAVY